MPRSKAVSHCTPNEKLSKLTYRLIESAAGPTGRETRIAVVELDDNGNVVLPESLEELSAAARENPGYLDYLLGPAHVISSSREQLLADLAIMQEAFNHPVITL